MINNPLTVANLFNEHFCNVSKSVQLRDATYRKWYNVDQFCIPPLTIDFFEKELNAFNNCPFTYIYIQLQR